MLGLDRRGVARLRDAVKDERDEDGVNPYAVDMELAMTTRAPAAVQNFMFRCIVFYSKRIDRMELWVTRGVMECRLSLIHI